MSQEAAAARAWPKAPSWAIWTAATLALVILALLNPLNRDEGQYVAPAAMAPGLWPFTGYLYLQTPLQADLVSLVGRVAPGYVFILLRVITGLFGAGVLGLTYAAQRRMGIDRRTAAICTALLAGCFTFQFACGVVRNDALPALLGTAAILVALVALRAGRRRDWAWGVAGLLLGLAASAKISYAFPAAGAGLFLLIQLLRGRTSLLAIGAYAVGGIVGLLPSLLAWQAAPAAFVYGVFTFATSTPGPWFHAQHLGWVANPGANLLITTGVLMLGPALGVLILTVSAALSRGWRREIALPHALLLDLLIAASLVAAVLPTPTNFQYSLPLLPPLFIRFGLEARRVFAGSGRLRRTAVRLMGLGVAGALGFHAFQIVSDHIHKHGTPMALITGRAHWIGDHLRQAGASGFISTLDPGQVADSGYDLDPRFATGVFVYRNAGLLSPDQVRRIGAIGPQTLWADLDARPPAAIVIAVNPELERDLIAYAEARDYRLEKPPTGRVSLYIRPLTPPVTPAG